MKWRALLLSLALHLAPLPFLLFFFSGNESGEKAESYVIEAPLGNVFVKVSAEPEHMPKQESPSPAALAEKPAAPSGGAPGLPSGEPVPVGHIQPDYPAASRKLGEEGESVWMLTIAPNGRVTDAQLEKSSGHPRLDDAARDALLEARFSPGVQAGDAVAARKRFRIEFRLSESRPFR